jgi:extracellular elastinolytic metalloproteinase
MGEYIIINNPASIRTHPYSTNATTNPLKYGNLATLNEVHSAFILLSS